MSNESLKAKLAAYNDTYAKQCAKHPERVGLKHKNLYTPLDLEGFDYERDLGFPGEYPYTRGVQPTMYRGKLWTMRMYAGFSTAEESNKRYKYLIANGGTGLSCAFDLPTQIGYDSDDKMSAGEVGKVGVAIDSLYDMERLFDGIDLGKVSTSMTINAPASVLLAMYIAVAEKQGVPATALRGTIQNDILKEYAARGTYIFPVKPSMRLITDIFEYCSVNVPKWNTISISGYHIREAGSTAAQEIAFTIADGIAYIEAALKAGMKIDEFAGRLSFFWNAHNNVLEEVAKFRASRRLWATILKERFHAENPKSMKLRFHTQTAGSMLTAQQPNNNIIRVALQTAAAVMGGTQSLHTNSRDEALALPTTESVTIALRTQQIVAYESGLADVVDPLGGSYYVEAMTNAIEAEAKEYIRKIDEMGGAVEAIDKGYIQKEIQDAAYAWQMSVESGERTIVGVNKFTMEEPPVTGLLKIDASVGEKKKAQLAQDKANRDQAKVAEELAKLEKAAQTPAEGPDHVNLMPVILDCVRAYCTEGEICGVLRKVYGEYKPHNTL
ncbi:MAG: methylmalonyl-CoA mutase family protein [Dialister sp.]|jgi:methylmalonyl-CoA mutase N-terminal domain/subunit|nr:methylmalonyl-CoA mutase family protein [Dialister sp.]MCI6780861.1 methylmalonyl-CoA mutase family protein [Dialister sp.]MCI6916092.1 methylmalonyl-CoA mutase family protein [Dialister sp.]MCI7172333.1 methylmalonyl-CoA mutase family protein [Dialister sp.]MCI7319337.1 methylmalonyl-CoA mutase family protein [Dialister sp.]